MAGRQLQQPAACPSDLYATMLACWAFNPTTRPAFDHLRSLLLKATVAATMVQPMDAWATEARPLMTSGTSGETVGGVVNGDVGGGSAQVLVIDSDIQEDHV